MLDTSLITYLAKLSKIDIGEEEKNRLVLEMSAIVELMDSMNEVSMEEEQNLNGVGISLNDLRPDEVVPSYEREAVLNNASHKKDGFFVVPKIME